jgi:hypothetical protein
MLTAEQIRTQAEEIRALIASTNYALTPDTFRQYDERIVRLIERTLDKGVFSFSAAYYTSSNIGYAVALALSNEGFYRGVATNCEVSLKNLGPEPIHYCVTAAPIQKTVRTKPGVKVMPGMDANTSTAVYHRRYATIKVNETAGVSPGKAMTLLANYSPECVDPYGEKSPVNSSIGRIIEVGGKVTMNGREYTWGDIEKPSKSK